MTNLKNQKRELRRVMQARRAEAKAKNPDAARALCDLFLKSISVPPGGIVASYMAVGSEVDPSPLAEKLRIRGHALCLPVMEGTDQPLLFRSYKSGDPLVAAGTMAIPEPAVTAAAVEPDILLVPLLAFDRKLCRLGYGSGYYDRTLTFLRQRKKILAIGLGFSAQEVAALPTGPHDARLDGIVTDIKVF